MLALTVLALTTLEAVLGAVVGILLVLALRGRG